MTPKEKAIEIFNSMKGFKVKHSHSKKCAINAVSLVRELIKSDYWDEVYKELVSLPINKK